MAAKVDVFTQLHQQVRSKLATWAAALCLCLCVGQTAAASDISLPAISPKYTIHINAETVAKSQQGMFDVLAFRGRVELRQGGLSANANDLTLWIERSNSVGVQKPGKIICEFSGGVRAAWNNEEALKDERWMTRLFSLHPIQYQAFAIERYDIPQLNWHREPGTAVQLAQFTQESLPNNGPLAPPLLSSQTQQPAQTSDSILPTPGAIEWKNEATPNLPLTPQGISQQGLPSQGLVIPQDGSAPFAAGTPQQPEIITPVSPPVDLIAPGPQTVLQTPVPSPFAAKSVQFSPRGSIRPQISFGQSATPGEYVAQIRDGFRLQINGVQMQQSNGAVTDFGTVSIEADNAVVWLSSEGPVGDLFQNLSVSTPERPIELYLDGNIVFQQGNRVIYADRMYYNISSEYGMILSAEVLTPVPQYQGLLRLKADVIEQRDRRNFSAFGAAITSSRTGVPSYWLQADKVNFQDNRDESDLSIFAPTDASRGTEMKATANSNWVYLRGVPVFYWPTFRSNLSEQPFYLSSLRVNNDTIFGTQVYSEFDVFQILGWQRPEGTRWRLSLDYLSDRGPAIGSNFSYNRPTWLFGIPGIGFTDAWFIRDDGNDFLGSDRINLVPEEDVRGRTFSQNRLFVTPNIELMLETGWISDRNFLEQYFENEWDQQKDFSTALRLRRYNGNRMFDIYGQARVNDFFTESEWLPRINHYWLGQDLLGQRLTWSASSTVAYAHQQQATTPLDPVDAAKFALRPWETDSEGLRAITRQEVSLPLDLGAWKIIPFMSGEAGFWNEDVNQDDLTRLTGQAGIRTALPFWRAYPNVENRLFDLRGIAHKVVFESEFFYADSNADLDRLPLFDPLDDNAQEHFRRRFIFNTFGGVLPDRFDERNYALRSGMQRWVTGGSPEIVDDMMQVRLGLNQRWQTKRGLVGRERIVDLVSLDVDFTYFPKAERDNFGEETGAFNYDFRYQIGDRITLLSDGYFDVFSQGLKTMSAGAQMSRPGRGDAYVGFLSIEGPISANILNGYMNYRMNEKWILTSGAAFDFGSVGSIGQSISLTRIGEAALVRVGLNIDHGRDNVSFNFNIEPRFLPTTRLGTLGGELVPPAGLFGLE